MMSFSANNNVIRLQKKLCQRGWHVMVLCLSMIAVFAATATEVRSAKDPVGEARLEREPSSIEKQIRFPVVKFKLANGLTVILHQDRSVPLVSYQTWFRVGSKYEQPGYTGIAHLFEHLMFKGAKRYSGEQFDRILQANGGINNAFTSYDYTGYYENLPADKLELAMDLESDRMENLRISEENLKSEREVVKEERRFRVDNNPAGVLREELYATAFRTHPYRWPVIGFMDDLNRIDVQKANEFYRTYYAPNNAVIVIAGDFEIENAKKLVEKYYGAMKAQPIPAANLPSEPVQTAPRSRRIEKEVQATQFVFAYHSPKAGEKESYALDLLANILGQGPSSRLYQRLVYKDQLAAGVSVVNYSLQDAGLFQFYVTLKPGSNLARAQQAVLAEIWRPRNFRVSAAELEKAKNQVMKGYVDALKTVHGKAEALALNEILFGDYERLFSDLEIYNSIIADDILNAAKKYLQPHLNNLVVVAPMTKVKPKASVNGAGEAKQ